MTFPLETINLYTFEKQLDFWYYQIGANVIPFDTVNKRPVLKEWKSFQDNPIDPILYKYW